MGQKSHITKIDDPTDWVSSAVYVKKPNGQLRVCLEPRELNKHIKITKDLRSVPRGGKTCLECSFES